MGIIQNDDGPVIQIANEFTVVRIAYARTGNGERLVITNQEHLVNRPIGTFE